MQESRAEAIVHASCPDGHRQRNRDHLGKLFAGEKVYGSLCSLLFIRLVRVRRLLISTLDDNVIAFACLALTRAVCGKRTVALFLRPHACFGDTLRATVKRWLFVSLKRLPNLTLITLTPFNIRPEYACIAHVGSYDPQYWDLTEHELRQSPQTELSRNVREMAAGRPLICALGRIDSSKGVAFMVDILRHNPLLGEELLWVWAGHAPKAERQWVERLTRAGALVIDRYLTEEELFSLYAISSVMWACYAPDYDQASGIFGRAIQYKVPVILREGSLLQQFAQRYGVDIIPVTYGAVNEAATRISAITASGSNKIDPAQSCNTPVSLWRSHFISAVEQAL